MLYHKAALMGWYVVFSADRVCLCMGFDYLCV